MRLLRVEFNRIWWRRATKILLLVTFLITAATVASRAWETRPMTDSQREEILAQAQSVEAFKKDYERCKRNPEKVGVTDEPGACEDFLLQNFGGARLALDPTLERKYTSHGLAALALLIAILIGATCVGADFASGSISNQLLFVSNRKKVWLAKSVVATIVGVFVGLLALGLFWGGIWAILAQRKDAFAGDELRLAMEQAGRILALTGLAGFGGFALTTLFRSTIATLGILFGVAVVGSTILALLPIEGAGRFQLTNNIAAIISTGTTYFDPSLCRDGTGECMASLSLRQGAAYLGTLTGLAALGSMWSFWRRDVP